MEIVDYSPSDSPTSDQQQDALRKGLGRAMGWAKCGKLDRNLLLKACLEDQRFDVQFEEYRGHWLWRLIETVDAVNEFRAPLFHALNTLEDEESAPNCANWLFTTRRWETMSFDQGSMTSLKKNR